jgi:hypothetical protein
MFVKYKCAHIIVFVRLQVCEKDEVCMGRCVGELRDIM